jgi:imidazole glycerol-phosphate synthase subunit HisH
MITIVDYGTGNLASVFNAVNRYTKDVRISSDIKDIINSDKIMLPGVGAFRDAYNEIEKRGLRKGVLEFIESGRLFLGICLGLQLLFTKSYEDGEHKGFDVIKGEVVPFSKDSGLKVPHMGWNNISQKSPFGYAQGMKATFRQCSGHERQNCKLLEGVADMTPMYFVHSYYVVPEDKSVVAATTDYGISFCSMIQKDNVYAMQFHPEKSQAQGLKIIENFVRL